MTDPSAPKLADLASAVHLEDFVPPPYGWILRLAAPFVGVGVVAAAFLGFVAHERHVGAASQAPKIEAARDQADSAQLSVQGERESAGRIADLQSLSTHLHGVTGSAVAATGAAPDAKTPLDPARLARLRAFDEQLCALRPTVCPGAAAAVGDARPGAPVVQPAPHADGRDAG